MIKILRHGDTHTTVTCPKCNCRFVYDAEDLQHEFGDFSGHVTCPECNEKIVHRATIDDKYEQLKIEDKE